MGSYCEVMKAVRKDGKSLGLNTSQSEMFFSIGSLQPTCLDELRDVTQKKTRTVSLVVQGLRTEGLVTPQYTNVMEARGYRGHEIGLTEDGQTQYQDMVAGIEEIPRESDVGTGLRTEWPKGYRVGPLEVKGAGAVVLRNLMRNGLHGLTIDGAVQRILDSEFEGRYIESQQ